jgi:cytochrome c556
MTARHTALGALAAVGALALLVGCGPKKAETTAATTTTTTTTEAPPAAPAPKPPFTVKEMMVMIVDQPGERLWDAEKAGRAPYSVEDWYQLENHAVSLAGAATLIQLGGTGPNDEAWAKEPEWRSSSQALVTSALAARQAAQAKNLPALIKANGQIVDACEACHAKFKPDIPTGGLFIHKRPGIDRP